MEEGARSVTPGIYMNSQGELMLAWPELRYHYNTAYPTGSWYFQVEDSGYERRDVCITNLAPEKWGWERIDNL